MTDQTVQLKHLVHDSAEGGMGTALWSADYASQTTQTSHSNAASTAYPSDGKTSSTSHSVSSNGGQGSGKK